MSSALKPAAGATLSDWLQYLESIHATAIDMGLERVREVAARMNLELPGVKFVVGGTNGKGSTCSMLESILLAAGYKVGLYTSPHLIDFNERARVNGQIASDEALIEQFIAVEAARGETSLTYFEFTTLAIMRLFSQSRLDAVVLEVGLGGRLDAVNIIDADCAVVTSVDLDHIEYLGDTREKIGFEKAHIYRAGRPAICADPVPPQSLLDYVEQIGADLWLFSRDYNYSGDRQQWAYGGREQRRSALAYPALRGANQLLNASAALAALESVRDRLPVPQQAVRLGLLQASLPGRFQILPGQPTVILDVAHNPHAAAVLAQNLDEHRFARLDVAHESEAAAFQRHGFRGHHPLDAFVGFLAADAQRTDAVGIAERQQAVTGNLRHHGVGTAHALMHGGDGAEHGVVVERDATGGRLQLVGQHVQQHFRVGIGVDVAAVDAVERLTQLAPVGQVAVVGEHDAERGVDVERLGLFLAGAGAGGGIADLADARGARQGTHVARAEYVAHQAVRLVHIELVALRRRNARGILPAMLQQQQAVIEQLVDRPAPDDPYDSTHGEISWLM